MFISMRKNNKKKKERYMFLAGTLLSFVLGFSLSNLLLAKTHLNNTAIKGFNQTEFAQKEPATPAKSEEKPQAKTTTDSNSSCPVKGNRNTKGEQIYHIPGGLSYNRVKGTTCFQNEAEANAAGYRKALR
jgi:hypothetical protein